MTVSPIEVETECNQWENYLIGYVIGDSPAFKDMLKIVHGVWNFLIVPRVYLHDEGYSLSCSKHQRIGTMC